MAEKGEMPGGKASQGEAVARGKGDQLPLFLRSLCKLGMKRAILPAAFISFALAGASVIGQQTSHDAQSAHATLYPPAEIQWKEGPPSLPPGAKIAVLEGDPSKEGMFVMRVRLPDGYHVPAHTHPKPERVTVISGTFRLAMGENPKKENARVLPPGTYGVWPPGMVHAVWIEGETTVQFHGMGAWTINYVNPDDDPRKGKKAQ
jgi:quercetin dioxygenase-like cupin family protein